LRPAIPQQPKTVTAAFPDLKGQAPLQRLSREPGETAGGTFPDLKGQAPLRPDTAAPTPKEPTDLFLTSKVRLHCDSLAAAWRSMSGALFLTSKVRLHCDCAINP